ncbi:hypothetical protein, partial [Pseudomonas grimontii]
MKLFLQFIFLCSLFLGTLAQAGQTAQIASQPIVQAVNATSSAIDENASTIVTELKAEVKLLKAQNKLIRDYQGSMSDTVYWALGIISGVFAILMSYSIFTNFKFYEQDKARLKIELDSVISSFKSELLMKFKQDRSDLEMAFDTRNESNMKIVLDQGAESRIRADAIRTELQTKIDDLGKVVNSHEAGFLNGQKRAYQIEYELRAVEEHVWEIKGVPDCILLTQCQGLRAAKDASFDYATTAVLKRMDDT